MGCCKNWDLKEGEAIIHPWINKALEKAQKKVEARNFDIRKNLLKFDDVMNDQRKVIFEQRIELMEGTDLDETIADMRHEVVEELVGRHVPKKAYAEQWDIEGLNKGVEEFLNITPPVQKWADEEGIADEDLIERINEASDKMAAEREERFGPEIMGYVEKSIVLQTLDHLWQEHLVNLDHLRSVVGFRGYGQRDPLQEYKSESFELFQVMLANMRQAVTTQMMRFEVAEQEPEPATALNGSGISAELAAPEKTVASNERDPDNPATWGKVGRNETCPCGTGKKFKHCHGKLA